MSNTNKVIEIIFPNPCSLDFCQVKLNKDVQNAFYQIVDLHGKLIQSGYFPFNQNLLDLKNISNGLFFVRINSGLNFEIIPLTVQR